MVFNVYIVRNPVVGVPQIFINGEVPHYRSNIKMVQQFRDELAAKMEPLINLPIRGEVEVYVRASDRSIDLGNLALAVTQAMDGHTLSPPHILVDDGQIRHLGLGYSHDATAIKT